MRFIRLKRTLRKEEALPPVTQKKEHILFALRGNP
jgi:hypothetical protein